MPRLFHRPPKYRLHKSTNQAVVSFNGQKHYLGPYGSLKSHQGYQKIVNQWKEACHQEQLESPTPKSPEEQLIASITTATLRDKRLCGQDVVFNELILVYRRHARQYYRKNGKLTREAGLIDEVNRLLRKFHGQDAIEAFGPNALDQLRESMIDDLDWSRKHINKQVQRIVRMVKWAAQKELCTAAVPEALKQLTGLKKGRCRARESLGVQCVEDKIVDATLPHLPEVVADMVRLQRFTGARPGEICAIRPKDIDRSESVWLYRPDKHKTEHFEKDRGVVIGPKAQKILKPYLHRPADQYCFSPAESELRRRGLIAKQRSTPLTQGNSCGTNRVSLPRRKPSQKYSTDSYRRAIHRVCERKDIKKWHPNQLRHTASTEIRKKYGLEAAQVICGHQSADVTQIYAERDLDLAKRVAKEMG